MAITQHDLQMALLGGSGEVITNALNQFNQDAVGTLTNNANTTLTNASARYQYTAVAITADRTITLPTNATAGDSFHITRTAASTGAFNLTVAGRALTAGQWALVVYNGSAWYVAAAGALA